MDWLAEPEVFSPPTSAGYNPSLHLVESVGVAMGLFWAFVDRVRGEAFPFWGQALEHGSQALQIRDLFAQVLIHP